MSNNIYLHLKSIIKSTAKAAAFNEFLIKYEKG